VEGRKGAVGKGEAAMAKVAAAAEKEAVDGAAVV
jgi:hypothetical protein